MLDILNPVFTDEDKAREHLETLTWPDGPVCPHCGETEKLHRLEGKSHRKGLIQCNNSACLKNFTVTVGTVFERSKIPLNKWLLAAFLMASSKKGMSAHQIHRMLGVTYKTAWFMMHRIREAMKDDGGPLGGPGKTVEADETYIGGKMGNRANRNPAPKKAVVALVERDGRARSFHVANVNHNNIRPILYTNVDRASDLRTDGAQGYKHIGRQFRSHGSVDHRFEYVRGDAHSNTAENFFSILKRGVVGTYHHWSKAHLHRYLAEFDFRYNSKEVSDAERSDELLKGIVGKRLTYRRTASLAA